MKLVSILAVALILAQLLPSSCRAEEEYEPCHLFQIETSAALKGKAPMSEKETVFTVAQLPWVPLEVVPRTHFAGFVSTEVPVELDFQGKKIKGTKVTWMREPKQAANIKAAVICFWVSKEVSTPAFPLLLEHGFELRVPEGCVKLEVVAHEKGAKGINQYEMENTVSVSGGYKQATTYKLGDESFKAHEFTYTVPTASRKGTWTVTLSSDMPGGICAMRLEGDDNLSMRVAELKMAALPKGLDVHAKEKFAFAPPAGYVKAQKLNEGEVARYVKGKDSFISISTVELGKEGLEGLLRRLTPSPKTTEREIHFTGFSRAHHIAGHSSFDVTDPKTNLHSIFTEHAGRGYKITITGLDEMTPAQAGVFLEGWRWMKVKSGAK